MDHKKNPKKHRPNRIPLNERISAIVLSSVLMGYSIYGVYKDDFLIIWRHTRIMRRRSEPMHGSHVHGLSAWLVFAALVCLTIALLSIVVDHYDKRDNEIKYKQINRVAVIAGIVFFVLAFIIGIYTRDVVPYVPSKNRTTVERSLALH